MFRKFGDFIYRTPWWGLLAGGVSILLGLALFAIPFHVLRLSDHAKTPKERNAIKREINLAFGDRALDIAESVVGAMKSRASDPERQRELDQALAEMARARQELSVARSGVSRKNLEAAQETAKSALETATTAAESALASATEAREALEEARNDTQARLRETGVDTKKTMKSFDEMIKSARESEATANESLAALGALKLRSPAAPASIPAAPPATAPPIPSLPAPAPSAVAPPASTAEQAASAAEQAAPAATIPAVPPAKGAKRAAHMSIDLNLSDEAGAAPLSQSVRNDIRAKVAGDVWRVGVGSALILLFIPIFIMLVIAKYFIGRSRRALAFAELKKREADVSDVNRQITEARLQALQAQVEPHFLYNTLANVQALTEADPPAANAMVGHLIQYLRAALPKMRENTSTIGQEVELVTAYLNVLKMRMGARLEFGIDVPTDLLSQPFPPMMLPSLVENAIKHGLEPLREGGRIDLIARRTADSSGRRIWLEVKDTGRGLTDSPDTRGGGVGLTNLRERLAALYGGAGRFKIESNDPRGVVAAIDIPADAAAMEGPGALSLEAGAAASPAEDVATGWRRAMRATSRTHSVWAWIATRIFLGLMTVLAVVFLIMLIALYTGWLPIDAVGLELGSLEGMAVGSIVLLVGFAVCALVIAIVAAVFYGLGFLLAVILLAIPLVILASLFPVLAPFIVIGLLIYWLWWRKKKRLFRKSSG